MFSKKITDEINEQRNKYKDYVKRQQTKRKINQLKAKLHDLSGRSYFDDYKIYIKDKNINNLINAYNLKGDESLYIICNNKQVLRSLIAVYYRLSKKTHKKTYNTLTYNSLLIESEEPPEDTAVLVFELWRYNNLSQKQKDWLCNNLITKGEARKPLDMSTIIVADSMIEPIKQSGVFQVINIGIDVLRKYGLTEDCVKVTVKEKRTEEDKGNTSPYE